ncbi:alpha/beta hydrolase [Streptacidiphilus sp. PB12-B1b]|uniref:alpha/beta fold hydrolase n=1 Tax=Streptacidiphilus sp. PB12-B1b TaxID=2705012 RepID=UPI0015F9EEFF|nr:alpha/beta hydrolase [Streptacidiphilus sp. PB12-B1b]QMU74634.1 alpha/beta hydrolase [Streptacidiphilus sp. PB12-B1b]
MAVYVPSGTDSSQLGALVLLHGVGGSGPSLLPRFQALARLLNVALLCPTARPVEKRSNRLDMAGLFGNRFDAPCWDLDGDDFPLAALYWARTTLNVHPDRCMVVGVSMGALATWNLAMRFWGRFCAAVPINGALSMWEAFGTDLRKRALLRNLLPLPLFVVHGAEDTQILPRFDRESVAGLRELGHGELRYSEVAGGRHALGTLDLERGESPRFRELAGWLAGRHRSGAVTEIRHRALDHGHARAYWVELDRLVPQSIAEVHAERMSGDAIRIRVSGAQQVRLHLRSDLFAPGDVSVEVNGVLHTVEFRPETSRLLQSYRETGDPELLDEQVTVLSAGGDGPLDRGEPR